MTDKWTNWINTVLIPFIVDKHTKLNESACNVQLKSSKVSLAKESGVIFTVCYRIKIVLDVDDDEQTLAIFVKVKCPMIAMTERNVYQFISIGFYV